MNLKTVEELIASHEARDEKLRNVFLQRKVDLTEPRLIECHFWVWSEGETVRLAEGLKRRGFEILLQRPAGTASDPDRWNLEAAVRQSIALTMRHEFIDELVRLADSNGGVYDGWGTRI